MSNIRFFIFEKKYFTKIKAAVAMWVKIIRAL